MGGGRPVRYDTTFSEGKCFLGGLDTRTSKESLHEYCSPWCVVQTRVLTLLEKCLRNLVPV